MSRERERLFSGEICFHRVIRPLKTDFFFLHYFFVNLVLLPNKKAEKTIEGGPMSGGGFGILKTEQEVMGLIQV
jgi:hypothetical protein